MSGFKNPPKKLEDGIDSKLRPYPKPTKLSPRKPRQVMCVGNYDLKQTIGKGQFGKVKLAKHVLTKEPVCILSLSWYSLLLFY